MFQVAINNQSVYVGWKLFAIPARTKKWIQLTNIDRFLAEIKIIRKQSSRLCELE